LEGCATLSDPDRLWNPADTGAGAYRERVIGVIHPTSKAKLEPYQKNNLEMKYKLKYKLKLQAFRDTFLVGSQLRNANLYRIPIQTPYTKSLYREARKLSSSQPTVSPEPNIDSPTSRMTLRIYTMSVTNSTKVCLPNAFVETPTISQNKPRSSFSYLIFAPSPLVDLPHSSPSV